MITVQVQAIEGDRSVHSALGGDYQTLKQEYNEHGNLSLIRCLYANEKNPAKFNCTYIDTDDSLWHITNWGVFRTVLAMCMKAGYNFKSSRRFYITQTLADR